MLQRLQAFAPATDKRTTVFALEVDPCGLRRLFNRGLQLNAHRVDYALDKRRDLSGQGVVHAALLSIRVHDPCDEILVLVLCSRRAARPGVLDASLRGRSDG